MSDSTIRSKLKEMAQLSIFANRISEVQEKNLKNYPFVFFNEVKAARINYDFGHAVDEKNKEVHHNSSIFYYLIIDEEANKSFLEKRFLALEVAVRNLFWKDVKLEVYFNDKKVYESADV